MFQNFKTEMAKLRTSIASISEANSEDSETLCEEICLLSRRLFTRFIQMLEEQQAEESAHELLECLNDAIPHMHSGTYQNALASRASLLETFLSGGILAFESALEAAVEQIEAAYSN